LIITQGNIPRVEVKVKVKVKEKVEVEVKEKVKVLGDRLNVFTIQN
jgi:hypothetical protein